MAKIFKKSYDIKLPKSHHEAEEFTAKKGLVLCESCGAVYYKKHWHHNLERLNSPEVKSVSDVGKKDTSVKFLLCPACAMIKNKQYEGRIIIQNVPKQIQKELEELILGYGKRAYDRDPMHRLIEVNKNTSDGGKNVWQVTTTENQLANKLAKKIKSAFHKTKSKVRFNAEPGDVAEIALEF